MPKFLAWGFLTISSNRRAGTQFIWVLLITNAFHFSHISCKNLPTSCHIANINLHIFDFQHTCLLSDQISRVLSFVEWGKANDNIFLTKILNSVPFTTDMLCCCSILISSLYNSDGHAEKALFCCNISYFARISKSHKNKHLFVLCVKAHFFCFSPAMSLICSSPRLPSYHWWRTDSPQLWICHSVRCTLWISI